MLALNTNVYKMHEKISKFYHTVIRVIMPSSSFYYIRRLPYIYIYIYIYIIIIFHASLTIPAPTKEALLAYTCTHTYMYTHAYIHILNEYLNCTHQQGKKHGEGEMLFHDTSSYKGDNTCIRTYTNNTHTHDLHTTEWIETWRGRDAVSRY